METINDKHEEDITKVFDRIDFLQGEIVRVQQQLEQMQTLLVIDIENIKTEEDRKQQANTIIAVRFGESYLQSLVDRLNSEKLRT